jgi:hypothetical protein
VVGVVSATVLWLVNRRKPLVVLAE